MLNENYNISIVLHCSSAIRNEYSMRQVGQILIRICRYPAIKIFRNEVFFVPYFLKLDNYSVIGQKHVFFFFLENFQKLGKYSQFSGEKKNIVCFFELSKPFPRIRKLFFKFMFGKREARNFFYPYLLTTSNEVSNTSPPKTV